MSPALHNHIQNGGQDEGIPLEYFRLERDGYPRIWPNVRAGEVVDNAEGNMHLGAGDALGVLGRDVPQLDGPKYALGELFDLLGMVHGNRHARVSHPERFHAKPCFKATILLIRSKQYD
jgi:hypothetical protein